MRIGIVSPNLIDNIDEWNAYQEDANSPWFFDEIAKKTSLLFDQIYLTDDLEVTLDFLGNCWPEERAETLRYLQRKKFIFSASDLGYASSASFLESNIKGEAATLHRAVMRVRNPGLGEWDDALNVGHPDMGDYAAQNGWHPRSKKGWSDPAIRIRKQKYESLLLLRNAAMLHEAGADVAIVGRVYPEMKPYRFSHPVWSVLFQEMPQLDTRASWEDVFDFRNEERTQHLIRNLRRWVRKIIAERWSKSELEDEVRELVYEYETHLRVSRMNGGKEALEFVITGAAEIAEDLIKLRFRNLAKLATAFINFRAKALEAETNIPGRELAIISELRQRF